jgi:tetratricopeptide (TPR) repeat protein
MVEHKGRIIPELPGIWKRSSRHLFPAATAGGARALLISLLLLVGCGPPRVVRVPVTPENIIKANDAARDADLAFARRDYYAALIKYLEAAKLNPNSEYIYNKLGIAYSQLKYYTEATQAFTRSMGLNPKYPYPYNNLGTVYFAIADKKKAEQLFKKAVSISPNVASFHINLGQLYFEKRQFEKGMAELRKGVSLDPAILAKSEGISLTASGSQSSPTEKNYFMARFYASMGDAERAVDSLQQALNAGFSDIELIQKERDFDPIRQDQRFVAFMRTATLVAKP